MSLSAWDAARPGGTLLRGGRVQARCSPLGPGARGWAARARAAGLQGGAAPSQRAARLGQGAARASSAAEGGY